MPGVLSGGDCNLDSFPDIESNEQGGYSDSNFYLFSTPWEQFLKLFCVKFHNETMVNDLFQN